jgi:hypothetical protein
MMFDPDNSAFDEESRPVESVDFDYGDEGDAVEPCATAPDIRQLVLYLLEGGHGDSWKTRAGLIAMLVQADGWETPAKVAHRLGIDTSTIRKAKAALRAKFLAREQVAELRENICDSDAK